MRGLGLWITAILSVPALARGEDGVAPPDSPRYSVTRDEMLHLPGSAADSLGALWLLPGVHPGMTGRFGGASIRASSGQADMRVTIDGVPLMIPFHLDGTSIVDPLVLHSMALLDAPGAAYPGSLNGTIELTSRDKPESDLKVRATADVNGAASFIHAPLGERGQFGSALVSVRSALSNLTVPLLASGPRDPVSASSQWDYFAAVTLPLPGGQVAVHALGGFDRLAGNFALTAGVPAGTLGRTEMTRHVLWADVRWGDPLGWHVTFTPWLSASQENNQQIVRGFSSGSSLVAEGSRLSTTVLAGKISAAGKVFSWLKLELGGELRRQWQEGVPWDELFGDFVPTWTGAFSQWTREGYAQATATWGPVSLKPGLRIATRDYVGIVADPHLLVTVRPFDTLDLWASAQSTHPTPDRYVVPFSDTLGWKEDMRGSTFSGVAAGVSLRAADLMDIDLGAFHRAEDRPLFEVQHARADGLEARLQREFGAGTGGWISYAIIETSRDDDPGHNQYIGPDNPARDPGLWDQEQLLSIVWSQSLPAGWRVSGRFSYASAFLWSWSHDLRATTTGGVRMEKTFAAGGLRLTPYLDASSRGTDHPVSLVNLGYTSATNRFLGLPFLPVIGLNADL